MIFNFFRKLAIKIIIKNKCRLYVKKYGINPVIGYRKAITRTKLTNADTFVAESYMEIVEWFNRYEPFLCKSFIGAMYDDKHCHISVIYYDEEIFKSYTGFYYGGIDETFQLNAADQEHLFHIEAIIGSNKLLA